MPLTDLEEHALGRTWVVEEPMERAYHALVDDGRVWLVDPLDRGLEEIEGLGEPAGVLQLLDRHNRDCAEVAARFGVPHLKVPDAVPGSPFGAIPVVRLPGWKETALWWPEREALIVAETLAANPMHTGGDQPVAVHFVLRAWPPGALRKYRPQHLLLGHGHSLHGAAAADGLETAYARSRRDLPRVLLKLPGSVRS
ncbi:MAG TPA: hypothetical protein VFX85_01255 [Solirubrobacterales bacterium]|nr:hypothetical protein [Solirubrobacterales bacterium]